MDKPGLFQPIFNPNKRPTTPLYPTEKDKEKILATLAAKKETQASQEQSNIKPSK